MTNVLFSIFYRPCTSVDAFRATLAAAGASPAAEGCESGALVLESATEVQLGSNGAIVADDALDVGEASNKATTLYWLATKRNKSVL